MNRKFALVKINELPLTKEELKKRASGNWGITQPKMANIEYVIVTFRTEVVAVYKLKNIFESNEEWGTRNKRKPRLAFELEETEYYKEYLNQRINTRASNPISTILEKDIQFK